MNVIKREFLPCQFGSVEESNIVRSFITFRQTFQDKFHQSMEEELYLCTICGLLQAIFGFSCSGAIRAVRKRRDNEAFSKQNHLDLDCLGLIKLFQVGFSGRSTPLPEDQMCSCQTAGELKHIKTKSKPIR